MKRYMLWAMFALAAVVLALGLFVQQAPAITGGKLDTDNTYSNVGAVVFFPPGFDRPFVGGSGTLIHAQVLLTAGHVASVFEQYPELLHFAWVSFGTDALDPSTWREIKAGISHPDYIRGGTNNPGSPDVGVVILEERINDLPLAKLAYEGILDDLKSAHLLRVPGEGGVPFRVAGYGSTLQWPPTKNVPADGPRRFADSDYLGLLPAYLSLQQNLATGNGGTGYGDSGGPVFWRAPDAPDVLVAITAWGGSLIGNGFYYRIDTAESLEFIRSIIASFPP